MTDAIGDAGGSIDRLVATLRELVTRTHRYWPDDDYFHGRNREKIGIAVDRAADGGSRSIDEIVSAWGEIAAARHADGIDTIFVMSNGGSGCHYMGSLLSELPGFSLTDEVYLPVKMLQAAEQRPEDRLAIEALNMLHTGSVGHRARHDWIVNIGHVRPEAPPSRLRPLLPNAKFVLLVRSPFDVAISRGLRKPVYRAAIGGDEIDDLAYLGRQASITAAHYDRVTRQHWDAVLRYEHLIADPHGTLSSLLRALGFESSPYAIDGAIRRQSTAYRSGRQGDDEHDNHNLAPRPQITPAIASLLADTLTDQAATWGYRPPAPVADRIDRSVATAGRSHRTAELWPSPMLAGQRSPERAELLRGGRVIVAEGFDPVERPDDPDWTADPLRDERWREAYHALGWLVAASEAAEAGTDAAFHRNLIDEVLASWSAANLDRPARDELAWSPSVLAHRTSALATLLHEHLADRLDRIGRDAFVATLAAHVEMIADIARTRQWNDPETGADASLRAHLALGSLNVASVLADHPLGRRARMVGIALVRAAMPSLRTEDAQLLAAIEPFLVAIDVGLDTDLGIDPIVDLESMVDAS